jgi:hypothetical protein
MNSLLRRQLPAEFWLALENHRSAGILFGDSNRPAVWSGQSDGPVVLCYAPRAEMTWAFLWEANKSFEVPLYRQVIDRREIRPRPVAVYITEHHIQAHVRSNYGEYGYGDKDPFAYPRIYGSTNIIMPLTVSKFKGFTEEA